MSDDKTIIGLTGNIGTGKSAVMRIAAEFGILTIDADKVVHGLYASDDALKKEVADNFGRDVVTADGRVNRRLLGSIVFADPAKLKRLEEIVQPKVRTYIRDKIASASAQVIMIEAIKLLEGDLVELCDTIWVTNCGKFRQMQRLVIARGMDEEEAFDRILKQSPQSEKVKRADIIINTIGSMADTRIEVMKAIDQLPRSPVPAVLGASIGDEIYQEDAHEAPGIIDTAPAVSEPAAIVDPEPEEAPFDSEATQVMIPTDVTVRRARPSDIPSILLVIQRATGGKLKPKRAEILMSLSERGYLIGQAGSEITAVVGWYADKGFGAIDQFYIYPPAALLSTGKAVLEEVGKTANELMCEAVFAFVNDDTQREVKTLLSSADYIVEDTDDWPRVWQLTLKELMPDDADEVMIKKLWNARVA